MTACDETEFPCEAPAEPGPEKLRACWNVAIGLQQTDGLEPSAYLKELADSNISGHAKLAETNDMLRGYYRNMAPQGGEG